MFVDFSLAKEHFPGGDLGIEVEAGRYGRGWLVLQDFLNDLIEQNAAEIVGKERVGLEVAHARLAFLPDMSLFLPIGIRQAFAALGFDGLVANSRLEGDLVDDAAAEKLVAHARPNFVG